MMKQRKCWTVFLWASSLLLIQFQFGFTDAYDDIDPFGNITINWDFQELRDDNAYTVLVTMHNYQLYRHIENPGWRLGWTWPGQEVIWDMRGAEAAEQGNCSRFRGTLPHCCEKNPVILDMLPGAPYNLQTNNCCRGGLLSSMTQNPSNSLATFQMSVGGALNYSKTELKKPFNFSLGVPGYTCSNASSVPPTKYVSKGSRRKQQALMTWQVICTYSQFRDSGSPGCCVSLSSFYNDTVVSCPLCSCGCQDGPFASNCLREGEAKDTTGGDITPTVRCTHHMCPIRVHWHVKLNYREYWRVKMTVTNFNINRNYSEWSLVVQHPNLQSLTQVFSFNYRPLIVYGSTNDTGVFWGVNFYNNLLLQNGENGNVQTEMLLQKDPGNFTFLGGWAFPRKISFNGQECVMPTPDMYPALPNAYAGTANPPMLHILSVAFSLILVSFVLLFL